MQGIEWLESLLAGLLLTNGVPHFVKGVCGDRFPTPFAHPPGRGLSSPMLNVVWGLLNFLLGGWLAHVAELSQGGPSRWAFFAAGVVLLSLWSSWCFAQKHKES